MVGVQLVCVGFVGRTLWGNRSELSGTLSLGVAPLVVLLVLNFLGHLQRTYEFTYMLRQLGVREPFREGFLLTGAGFLLNHLPLNAGFVMRAMVLQRDHALPYSSYLSLTLVNIAANVAMGSCIGLAGVALQYSLQGTLSWLLLMGLLGALASCALAVWLPRFALPAGDGFVQRQLRNLARGVALIRGDGRAIAILLGLAFTKTVAFAVRLWICFAMLGRHLPYFDAGLLAAVQNLLGIVNITPGNLGLRELLLSMVSVELGSTRAIGTAAASIDRLVSISYILASGLPGIFSLRRRGPLQP